jgi:rpsU-divergently transcribed protein
MNLNMNHLKIEDPKINTLEFENLTFFLKSGFKEDNIIAAFEQSGHNAEYYWANFPLGLNQIFEEMENYLDHQTSIQEFEEKGVSKLIYNYVHFRLSLLNQYSHSFKEIYKFYKNPLRISKVIKANLKSVNLIWNLVEETGSDFSFYTKRATLLLIYKVALKALLMGKDWESVLKYEFKLLGKFHKTKAKLVSKFK